MERKTAHDFDQDLLDSFRRLRARRASTGADFWTKRRSTPWEASPPRCCSINSARGFSRRRSSSRRTRASRCSPLNTPRRRAMARCAATWRSRRRRPASCRPILVIHENRGLNPHIEDIARRLATTVSWRLRPMRCSRSAAIRATKTRRASSFRSSIRRRRARTSSRRPTG